MPGYSVHRILYPGNRERLAEPPDARGVWIVVVHPYLRRDARPAERGREEIAHKNALLPRGVGAARILPARLARRLVLRCHGVYRDAALGVALHVLHEVVREGRHALVPQVAADHEAGRLHPSRRAPRRGVEEDVRAQRLRGLRHRHEVDIVARKREVPHLDVPRRVVVAVESGGVVARPHVEPYRAEVAALGREQLAHEPLPLLVRHVRENPRRCVGH